MNSYEAGRDSTDTTKRSLAFRRALGNFLTGVTVVTTVDVHGRPRGITANSFTSVSLEPPLVLACIARSAESFDSFVKCGGFTVNILSEDQQSLSQLFASKSPDKFDDVRWFLGDNGAPVLDDCLAWFDCRMFRQTEAGDHTVLIGEVTRFDAKAGQPLGYCQGNYVNFALMGDAVENTARARVVFGCILHDQNRVLLCRDGGGSPWSLPMSTTRRPGAGNRGALVDELREAGIEAELGFLYSMFDVPRMGVTRIIYRGEMRSLPPARTSAGREFRLFPFEQIPWSNLASPQLADMLRRYVREQATDSFGIYVDGAGDGRVARLSGAPEPWRPD